MRARRKGLDVLHLRLGDVGEVGDLVGPHAAQALLLVTIREAEDCLIRKESGTARETFKQAAFFRSFLSFQNDNLVELAARLARAAYLSDQADATHCSIERRIFSAGILD